MTINWGSLGIVAVVSLAVGVLVVVLVSLALVGLSAREAAPDGEPVSADDTPIIGRGSNTMSPTVGTAVAGVCLIAAAAIVLYGLFVIVI
jgi:ABC-type nickel/cobalt efflux system permease component RcnA